MRRGDALLLIWMLMFWGIGIGLQHGFWNTFWAVIIPPYAWVVSCIWVVDIINHLAGM